MLAGTLRYTAALVIFRLSFSVGEAWGGTTAHFLITTCLGAALALMVGFVDWRRP